MAPVPSSVHAVQARVELLRARFTPGATPALDPAPPTTGFDPFGPVYQAAIAAAERAVDTGAALVSASTFVTPSTITSTGWSASGVGGAGSSGGYGRITPPADLAAYGNGRIPTDALEPIGQGGHRLWGPAAAAWRSLVDAAAADGVTIRITDSYRTYDQQVDLAARKGLYRDGGLAAVPGTSNHGWGMAVDADVNDPAALSWLRANGPRFGFLETVPREPWHWEYRPAEAGSSG